MPPSKPKHFLFLLLACFFATIHTAPVNINARSEIDYTSIVGFPQTVPATLEGESTLKFKPWLEVAHGCVPFAAVDAQGNTGAGLPISGKHNEGCRSNIGQVYSRSKWYNGRFAIMYSYYMPKDSPSPGLGHRHDWEGAIVWLDSSDPATAKVLRVATSGHGEFTVWDPSKKLLQLDGGTRAKLLYWSIWPLNHQLWITPKKGGEQPLIDWDSLPDAARTALQTTDFGSATPPFRDDQFDNNLAKASF